MSYPNSTITQDVTIAAGASLSDATVYRPGYALCGIVTASTWDAAKISLQGSWDKGATFANVKTGAAEFEVASTTGAAYIALDPAIFRGIHAYKVRSGISTAATNQADDTVVTLVFVAL